MDSRLDESIQFLARLYSDVAVKVSNSVPVPPSLQSGLQSDRMSWHQKCKSGC